MKKSSKRLIISTQAMNDKGFRVRTSGIDLSRFQKNPLLLWMHKRPTGASTHEVLPLGYVEDLRLEGEDFSGVPVFDDSDEFAMKICNKWENGTIKMGSAGLMPPYEFQEIDGEIWLERSMLMEVSLCDAGSNPEALAVQLYNEQTQEITLSQAYESLDTSKIADTMKIKLSAEAAKALNLAVDSEMDASEAIQQLVTLAAGQTNQIAQLTTAKESAETELATLKKEQANLNLNALINEAASKGKITEDEKPHYLQLGQLEGGFEAVKGLLASKPEAQPVAGQLAGKTGTGGKADELLKLTWDQLDKTGQLSALKEANEEAFKEKYKAKFGKEYPEG